MNLLIRADASIAIGTGHVMRCLALAQAWQDTGGGVTFVMAESTPAVRGRLLSEACEVVQHPYRPGSERDAIALEEAAEKKRAEWVVIDGYCFGAGYQKRVLNAARPVLLLDDSGGAEGYWADIVLNQNLNAETSMYAECKARTRFLLGTRFCLLRREFRAWREWKRRIASVGRKVLITMGGSDPENLTEMIQKAVGSLDGVEALVVLGGSNPAHSLAAANGERHHRTERNVNNMSELMAWADIAVAGAGTTCWEMCLLQLPMLLIDVAGNQRPIASALRDAGAAIHVGSAKTLTESTVREAVQSLLVAEDRRSALAQRCGALVDGFGAERVIDEMRRG